MMKIKIFSIILSTLTAVSLITEVSAFVENEEPCQSMRRYTCDGMGLSDRSPNLHILRLCLGPDGKVRGNKTKGSTRNLVTALFSPQETPKKFISLTESQEDLQIYVAKDIFNCFLGGNFTLYARKFLGNKHQDKKHPLFGETFLPLLDDVLAMTVTDLQEAYHPGYNPPPIPTEFRSDLEGEENEELAPSLSESGSITLLKEEWEVTNRNSYINIDQPSEEPLLELEDESAHAQDLSHQEENAEEPASLFTKGKNLLMMTANSISDVVSDTLGKAALYWWGF